jgi:hypothetical protein
MGLWILLVSSVVPATGQAELDDPNALRGQIIVHPRRPAWLKRNGGGGVFLCGPGDPEDFLYRGRRAGDGTRDGDQVTLIRKLIRHGGNCIYMQIIRSHGGDGQRDHNPFVDSDPRKDGFLWLDCTTGRRVERSGVKVTAGNQTWPRPAGIGRELAVWVRRGPSAAGGAAR